MPYQTIIFEAADYHVGTLTLKRPEQLNAFSTQLASELCQFPNRGSIYDAL